MVENESRIGNFTSSEIFNLCSFDKSQKNPGSSFYTYIERKKYERLLGRSLTTQVTTKDMTWGKFLEHIVLQNLGFEYELVSKTTYRHSDIPNWTGSPDLIVKGVKISEIKCYQPKNFASYLLALMSGDTEVIKAKHPKEYWQIVSNSIIHGVGKGEAILYMPYKKELDSIRELASDPEFAILNGFRHYDLRWIAEASNSELAYLPDNSKVNNLNIVEFDIPTKDILFLTKRVIEANKLLI